MNEYTELTPVEQLQKLVADSWEPYAHTFSQAINALAESFQNAVAIASDALSELMAAFASVEFDTWTLAEIWAEAVHPEWLAIYYRTKKARIRKKYRDRIMRSYMEVHT